MQMSPHEGSHTVISPSSWGEFLDAVCTAPVDERGRPILREVILGPDAQDELAHRRAAMGATAYAAAVGDLKVIWQSWEPPYIAAIGENCLVKFEPTVAKDPTQPVSSEVFSSDT